MVSQRDLHEAFFPVLVRKAQGNNQIIQIFHKLIFPCYYTNIHGKNNFFADNKIMIILSFIFLHA